MMKILKILLWLFILAMTAVVLEGEGNAAPGQFLFQWGAPHLLSHPRGAAVDSSGNTYTAEAETGRVVVFDGNGKVIRTWGSYGSGIGQFSYVSALAIAGNVLYIAEAGNDRVQVFDTGGKFLKFLGQGGAGDGQFAAPGGISVDTKGNVYVADTGNNRIQIFDSSGNFLRAITVPPPEYVESVPPVSVAVDATGRIYASSGEFLSVLDNTGKLIDQPYIGAVYNLAIDSTGKLYYSGWSWWNDFPADFVGVYQDGEIYSDFKGITGVATDANNNLYVTDQGNDCIKVFDSQANFLKKIAGDDGVGQFRSPNGVATDATGNVYVTDTGNYRIQLFDSRGKFVRKFGGDQYGTAVTGQSWGPLGITVDRTGKVYAGDNVAFQWYDWFGGNVRVFDTGGDLLKRWFISYDWFQGGPSPTPGGVTVDNSGNVYVTDSSSNQVDMFSSDGTPIRTWGSGGSESWQLSAPLGLAQDGSGNLYLADSGNKRIQVFNNYGTLLRSWGSEGTGDGQFSSPRWLTVDGADHVYVTDYDEAGKNNRVQVFDTQGTFLGKWGSYGSGNGQFLQPAGIATNLSGSVAYVVDAAGNRVQAFAGYGDDVPAGWLGRDIGSVGVKGRADYANGTFTIQGSGANIWGSTDAFHFVYQPLAGNGQIIARVASLKNTNGYAKGGVMIRQSLSANAMHAMMDLTPGYGAEFSRRTTAGGSTAVTARGGIAAPSWVKLTRSGSTFTGSVSADGVNWVQVGSASIGMTGTVYVGLAVNSHNNSVLTTAALDSVSVSTATPDTTAPTVTAFSIPATSSTLSVPITTLTASDNVGVTGYLVTESSSRPSATASGWSATKPLGYSFGTTGTKTLYAWAKDAAGNVSASRSAAVTVSGGALPSPWLTQDVGNVGLTGSASYANGTFTIKGSGADIWGSADAFRFVYKVLNGDGEIVARVASLQNTNSYAKGGVMIRQSLAPNSMHAMMDVKPTGGAEFSRRTATGGTTSATLKSGVSAPYWVKLTRSGNTFTGSVSSDGVTWSKVGSSTINMTGSVYVGLIVTSHNNSALCTTTIGNVK